jgi:hypothetical protein
MTGLFCLAPEGAIVTLKVRIDRHQPAPRGRGNVPYRVFAHDETGEIGLVFFHAKAAWLEKLLPVGETMLVSGRVEWFNGRPTMVHPDHMVSEANAAELPLVEPVYPLTAGVSPQGSAQGDRIGARTRAGAARMDRSARGCQNRALPASATASSACMRRKTPPMSIYRIRRGGGLPMTNCWPDSWRSGSCGGR